MKVPEFASLLFDIHTVAHVAHLQTNKFSDHMALNSLYQDIVELRDRFIESYQGKYGIIKGYKTEDSPEDDDIIDYLQDKAKAVESFREEIKDGYLQQIIDDILELLYSTLYKLKELTR